jgi:hypothetical protein
MGFAPQKKRSGDTALIIRVSDGIHQEDQNETIQERIAKVDLVQERIDKEGAN